MSNTEISLNGDSCARGIRVLLTLDVRALAKARGDIGHCLFLLRESGKKIRIRIKATFSIVIHYHHHHEC